MNGHYDETTLSDYLDDPESFDGRDALEAHLASCPSCRGRLEELKAFEAALSSTALWDFAEAARRLREPPEKIRSIADRLSQEDADAERFLTPILASPAAFRRADITSQAEMRTAGVVRKLCRVSRELRERQPMHALTLADAAIALGEQLDAHEYPLSMIDDLRGSAWLERANVLRYLGRYPEALDALAIAESALETTPVAVYSLALVQYLRGVIYVELERLDEALKLARQAARVFRQFGEDDRFVHAKIVEAGVLYHQGRHHDALTLFASLLDTAKQLGDATTLARLFRNVANCHLALGDYEQAHTFLSQAQSLYEALGLEMERIRTRWSVGALLVRTGRSPEGLARLHETRRDFERLGATTDAALVTLDIIEILLAQGNTREAASLCAGLVQSFSHVGMTGNALTALAFLREAVATGSATPILVRHVRSYLEQRPDAEGKVFVPPM